MLWGGRYQTVGTSCGEKREETDQEAGQGDKIKASSGERAETCRPALEKRGEVEREGRKATFGEEEEIEDRLDRLCWKKEAQKRTGLDGRR